MTNSVVALRGATSLEKDDRGHLLERVETLLREMISRNGLQHDDLISILFTATPDIHSEFPAVAAREIGLGNVPLMCAQELSIDGAIPLCIRVMMHVRSESDRSASRHVYLESAKSLRDDLPE